MNLNNDSLDQLQVITQFATQCIYKDSIEADKQENSMSLQNAASYGEVMYGVNKKPLTDDEREAIIKSYVEYNPYYKNLMDNYGVDPWIARRKEDFDILYFPLNLYNEYAYLQKFPQTYNKCRAMLYSSSYTLSMEDLPNYRALFQSILLLYTVIEFQTYWLQNYFDVDIMSDEQVDVFMSSFGIPYFRTLPTSYKRKIAKNLNKLVTLKGTDEVIINILEIFDFKDIEVHKYYLATKDIELKNGSIRQDDELRFYSHDIRIESLNKALKKDKARTYTYSSIVSPDYFWHASREEVTQQDIDFLLTKYFSIEYTQDIVSQSLEATYFINLIEKIRLHHYTQESLFINVGRIIDDQMSLYDLIVLLQFYVNKANESDNIVHKEYDNEILEYGVNEVNLAIDPYFKDLEIPKEYQIKLIPKNEIIDKHIVQNIFLHNQESLNYIKERIRKETNYVMYRRLLEYYRAQYFKSYFTRDLVDNENTYYDYLTNKYPKLRDVLDKIDSFEDPSLKRSHIENQITYINDSLSAYLDELTLTFSNLNAELISEYLKLIILTFKSFTITLRDISTELEFRDNLEFRLHDYFELIKGLELYDKITLGDWYTFVKEVCLRDKHLIFDYLGGIIAKITEIDTLHLRDDELLQFFKILESRENIIRFNELLITETNLLPALNLGLHDMDKNRRMLDFDGLTQEDLDFLRSREYDEDGNLKTNIDNDNIVRFIKGMLALGSVTVKDAYILYKGLVFISKLNLGDFATFIKGIHAQEKVLIGEYLLSKKWIIQNELLGIRDRYVIYNPMEAVDHLKLKDKNQIQQALHIPLEVIFREEFDWNKTDVYLVERVLMNDASMTYVLHDLKSKADVGDFVKAISRLSPKDKHLIFDNVKIQIKE